MNQGILFAVTAYLMWGLLPFYWKWLSNVSATETLLHRMVWSFVTLALILGARRQWQWLKTVKNNRKAVGTFLLTAVLIGLNWFIYIWAINVGRLVDASLGYFINPLVSVVLGVILLGERQRLLQWVAIVLAGFGVLYLTIRYGAFPWVALTLASSFALYGYFRKTDSLKPIEGLFAESAVLFLPALCGLFFLQNQGRLLFGQTNWLQTFLLAGAGLATAVPLIFFSAATRRIHLTTLGLLQYMVPTCQFLTGVFIFHEHFSMTRLIGFVFVWLALLLYAIEGILHRRHSRAFQAKRAG